MGSCKKCSELTGLQGTTNIYYGKSYKRVLLIGESPHKSWLETGNPFRNAKGSLSPSARNIKLYLRELGYSLEDVAVTEMISCYVADRRNLSNMMRNCSKHILLKIAEANPTLVIIMGQKTVQEFSKVINVDIDLLSRFSLGNRSYIAIYHPSPINPNNNKKNLKYLASLR